MLQNSKDVRKVLCFVITVAFAACMLAFAYAVALERACACAYVCACACACVSGRAHSRACMCYISLRNITPLIFSRMHDLLPTYNLFIKKST